MLRKRLSPFAATPTAYVSSIHAEDAGSAVVAALRAPAGIYNVVDDEPSPGTRGQEVGRRRSGVKPPRTVPRRSLRAAPRAPRLLMRSLPRLARPRFTEATGWTPAHPLDHRRRGRRSWA